MLKPLTLSLATVLVLLPIAYFLGNGGQASFFPSYLIGVFTLGLILFGKLNELVKATPITSSLVGAVLAYFCMDIFFLGGGTNDTLLYFGYALLIATFVYGLAHTAKSISYFEYTFFAALVAAAAVSSCFSIFLFYSLDYQPLPEHRLYAIGGLNNPVVSAISYGTALTICLTFLSESRERSLSLLTSLASLILIAAIILSGTRSVWPGLFTAVLILIVLIPKTRHTTIKLVTVSLSFVLLVGAALYLSSYSEVILKRSTSFRPEIWAATLSQWRANGIFLGAGIHSTINLVLPPHTFMHPHSVYLSTLYYGGVVGLLLFSTLISRLIWVLAYKADPIVRNYAISLLGFGLVTLIFDGNRIIEKVDYLWLCFWLPVSLTLLAELKFKAEPDSQ